ncbi:MAG: DUF4132 domain-containing protein [Bacteroidota bacterium]
MNIIERQQRLEDFLEAVTRYLWNEVDKETFPLLIDYLQNETTPLPTSSFTNYYSLDSIGNLFEKPEKWDTFDHRLLKFMTLPDNWMPAQQTNRGRNQNYFTTYYNNGFCSIFFNAYLREEVKNEATSNTIQLATKSLQQYGIPESQVLEGISRTMSDLLMTSNGALTSAGRFMLDQASQHFQLIQQYMEHREFLFTELLLNHNPALADQHLTDILAVTKDGNGETVISLESVRRLLKKNSEKYEQPILKALNDVTNPYYRNQLRKLFIEFLPAKYQAKALEYTYEYLEGFRRLMLAQGKDFQDFTRWDNEDRVQISELSEQLDFLLSKEGSQATAYIHDLLKCCQKLNSAVLATVIKHLGQGGLDILMEALKTDFTNNYEDPHFYRRFFSLLSGLDYQPYYPQIWAITKHKSKKMREMAAVTLSKLGEIAIPEATALLEAKSADQRQAAALILTLIPGDLSQKILIGALDKEKNDDARDIMLESLAGVLTHSNTEKAIVEKTKSAQQRGKLNNPIETWLAEEKLPLLHWKNSDKAFDTETVRYLFYRQSRAKDIRPDWEAKPILENIDRTRSHIFAKAILKAYFDNGADSKQKYCLTLAGLLGDDDTIDLLKSKVGQWAEASRGKMAEYVVKAIALSGTNKALRAVEFFSRKYKNKNKNIGEAAQQAFAIAAEEMGITPYELADSIIPDFGFVGLFREFEVNNEPFRAFIDNDFKLGYLNEDGKVFKSLPKNTDKLLVEEFKEIGKEVRDIVKSQSNRLEQYLVTQRKWSSDKWQAFFMGNPIMFAYAVRLIWGAFDQQGQLQFVFRCLEDQTLVNQEEEEIELPSELSIGMVHPLSITEEEVNFWKQHLEDSGIEPIFPQLNRPTVILSPSNQAITMSNEFKNIKVGGYHFVSQMEKLGWFRGSVVDGGSISSYYKKFPDVDLSVFLNIEGIGVGYYDEDAELQELYAVKTGSIKIGSYTYDEPSKTTDERLIPFGDIPAVIYSEIMSDLRKFVPKEQEQV